MSALGSSLIQGLMATYLRVLITPLLLLIFISCASSSPLRIFEDRCPKDAENVVVFVDACSSELADFHTALGSGRCGDRRHASKVIQSYKDAGGSSKVWLISYFYEKPNRKTAAFAQAVKLARKCKIPYVNISGGGYDFSIEEFTEIKRYTDSGGMVFAAMGNDSTDNPFYPAALPFDNVIGVGALTCRDDLKARYSNFGNYVDSWEIGCYNGTDQGTSYATPRALARWQLQHKLQKRELEVDL